MWYHTIQATQQSYRTSSLSTLVDMKTQSQITSNVLNFSEEEHPI